jgi:hypothetical protein
VRILIAFIFFLALFSQNASANLSFGARAATGEMQVVGEFEESSFLEAEFVSSYTFSQSLAIEGSVFGRFTDENEFWGLQVTSPVRLILPGGVATSYLAPGYRYMDDGFGAPLIEGGFVLGGLPLFSARFGLGYRFIFNEWVKNGLKTESQFFISTYF